MNSVLSGFNFNLFVNMEFGMLMRQSLSFCIEEYLLVRVFYMIGYNRRRSDT